MQRDPAATRCKPAFAMPLDSEINVEQRYWWRIALERRLRQCSGEAFQQFFSDVMALAHGDDFVRVRSFGRLGDKGCDGYLRSAGRLYQCFGALNGHTRQASRLARKIDTDFATAAMALPDLMREWHFVHNLIDGMPVEAMAALTTLERAHPAIRLGFFGLESFIEVIFKMSTGRISVLLGPAASEGDVENLDIAVLRKLVQDLGATADTSDFQPIELRPAPLDKLNFNQLPNHWKMLISGGWVNTKLIADYFEKSDDPMLKDRISAMFSAKYDYFKAQLLPPSEIMAALFELVTGIGHVTPPQQVAAQALLAYLFDGCHIFERAPDGVSQ
ncbi:ABC-three component system protein [Roseateles sp. L2-2]|uniref:ABC-three component system protein n=1 Tax=Roseateles sp. L2-2 TaxID=3422597 RepID=UPI003D3648E4